jgi:hypothetical protein
MKEGAQFGDDLKHLLGGDLGISKGQKANLGRAAPHLGNGLVMGSMGGVEEGFCVDGGDHGGSFWLRHETRCHPAQALPPRKSGC